MTIDTLEPKAIFRHFAALAAIPRASGKEAAARAYVLEQASRLGLEAIQDSAGNVVIRKPASPGRESAPMAALQSHLDMVCEKNEGTAHDFDVDPIQLVVDGDWLKAAGTTLGADNGVGVASALAVLESADIAHGPLEFVFTIDEEVGLAGASDFTPGLLRSKYFLNLDGEEEGTLCIGCAGGLNTVARRTFALKPAGAGAAWRVKVAGLAGGHSGIDIEKGRGNALRILGRVLEALGAEIAEIHGGSKRNAIPREAWAVIVSESELAGKIAALEAEVKAELGAFDPRVRIELQTADRPAQVLDGGAAIARLLACQHHGVLAMSPDVPGLVQTSTNLATIDTVGGAVEIATSQRSAIEASKQAAGRMVSAIFHLAGFDTEQGGGYPGWKPEPESGIVKLSQAVHADVLGETPRLVAMHAGLECGVIGEKHSGMEMISFGPHIIDVHSPSERLKISSVAPFWKFLKALLERL
ncbi:MAG: aminoacyl-histidine dipeptidase [Acidobacteria bacterium]|nr:aminoacyl-histidine dipeptidase [Acidobacteriota bacterium]